MYNAGQPLRQHIASVFGTIAPLFVTHQFRGRALPDLAEHIEGRSPKSITITAHQREDVASDGRFLMVENREDFPIVIVQNWPLELQRLVK